MGFRVGLVGSLLLALVACSVKPLTPSPVAAQPLGLLKVTITGIGEGAVAEAKAEWVKGVNGQTATVVPVNGTPNLNDVQLIRRLVSFDDDDLAGIRYVRATFDLVNRTTISFSNFTLYAVNVPTNLGGTGIIGMTAGTGNPITDPNVARSFKPMHAMRGLVQGLEVNPNWADLQFFTPAETSDIKNQAVSLGILTAADTVLEYGFVARGLSGGRDIVKPDSIPADCTNNSCKGTVTLAYQFPKVSPRNANPFSFSLYFVVANESVEISSQSLEEQTPNTVTGLANPSAIFSQSQLRILGGSNFMLHDKLNPLCRVKTAIAPDLFLGPDPIPTAAGSLDVCFGASGKRTTAFGSSNDQANSIAIQSDGKIVVAGSGKNGSDSDFAVARYNPSGLLDTTFSVNGKVTTDIGSFDDSANSVAIQSDGKIVLAGTISFLVNSDFALVRYNSNGSLDTSFDTDGIVTTEIGIDHNVANALAIYPNSGPNAGKIVAAGYSDNVPGVVSNYDFTLVRYNPSGSLDTSFGTGGIVTTDFPSGGDRVNSLALQSDGKIVVAGLSSNGSNFDFALARYNTNGSLDTSFSGDGKATTFIGLNDDIAHSLVIQSDGKIVVGGYADISSTATPNNVFALVRFTTNGSLDTTFSGDGKVTADIGSGDDFATSLALQSDGKIVLAGYSQNGSNNDFALARFSSGGTLDTSFDTDGKVMTPIGSGDDVADALALQSDGKIVLGGFSYNGSNADFALARYNP